MILQLFTHLSWFITGKYVNQQTYMYLKEMINSEPNSSQVFFEVHNY